MADRRTLRDSRGRYAGSRAGYGRRATQRLGDIAKPIMIAGLSIGRQVYRIPRKGANTTIGKFRATPTQRRLFRVSSSGRTTVKEGLKPLSKAGIVKVGLAAMATVAGVGAAISGAMPLSRTGRAANNTRPRGRQDKATRRIIRRYARRTSPLKGFV